jgi:hypothetical protein
MPPDKLVVRGGSLDDLDRAFKIAARDYQDDLDHETRFGYPLSVAVGAVRASESREAFLARIATEGEIRHNKVRVVSLTEIEGMGFRVIPDPPPPAHCVVDLGTEEPMARLIDFEALLGTPEENPCPFKQ